MVKTLESLGFARDGDEVIVPSWRGDVLHKADIAEEIARFYGYNKIPFPPRFMAALRRDYPRSRS